MSKAGAGDPTWSELPLSGSEGQEGGQSEVSRDPGRPGPQRLWHTGGLTSRSRPTCTVRMSPVCSSMLKSWGPPCSRMEYRRAALSVSGSSASVASALVT